MNVRSMTRLYVSPAFSLSTSSDYCTIQNQAFNATRKTSQGKIARCPGVTFYNTSNQPGPGKHSTKVGASGYAQEHLKFVQDPGTSAIVSHPGYWQLFWEAKVIDFAGDNGILFEHITDEKTKEHIITGFGQTSFFAAQMCANQYRDFAFSISLTDETARLLRWDRSGVIFSEAIHYRENPSPCVGSFGVLGMPTYCSVVQTCLYTSASRKLRRRSFGIL